MNVKEAHVVAGMSRDSSVSRQNPNLVYDAHNIRITTKDGKNSLLSVPPFNTFILEVINLSFFLLRISLKKAFELLFLLSKFLNLKLR